MELKSYLLKKLFFPRTVVIDQPGMVVSKTIRKFSKNFSKRRIIYIFEDTITELQNRVISSFGKEKSRDLFYKFGRDIALRYILVSKPKRIPRHIEKEVIQFVFSVFASSGLSAGRNAHYYTREKVLELNGSENMFCRKTKEPSFLLGSASGILSYLLEDNFEASCRCGKCPDECKAVIYKTNKGTYKPDKEALKPLKNYNSLNFPNVKINTDFPSMHKLMKHNFVKVDNTGKTNMYNYTLLPSQVDFTGIIEKNFREAGLGELFGKTVEDKSKEIYQDIFYKANARTTGERLRFFKNNLSAFGLGIPEISQSKNKLRLVLLNPPITKFGFSYQGYKYSGILNAIYGKKCRIENVKVDEKLPKVTFTFTF